MKNKFDNFNKKNIYANFKCYYYYLYNYFLL